MPKIKQFSILVDCTHGEMLDLNEPEFSEFAQLLVDMSASISFHKKGKITPNILEKAQIFIIGCPVNHYFVSDEIKYIIDYVLSGGNLIVISEYGGDVVQKTNLNDITKHFGIYFESTAIRQRFQYSEEGTKIQDNEEISSSVNLITDILKHETTKNVRKLMFGGCCTLRTAKKAIGICLSPRDSWIEIYDDITNVWVKHNDMNVPLVALTIYGQGRVAVFGDLDIFTSNARFGLDILDNKRLIQNIISWFLRPVSSEATIEWLLSQISIHRENFSNIIESMKLLEERVTNIESSQTEIKNLLKNNLPEKKTEE